MKIYTTKNKKQEKFLRQPTKKVDLEKEDKKELRELIKKMRKAMTEANGIGLSANQVGVDKRIFVIQLPQEDGQQKFYAVINPEITKSSEEEIVAEEGCLSIPEKYGFVSRPKGITLEGQSLEGKEMKIKTGGVLARVIQHEVDHLDGKLFIDRAKEVFEIDKTE